MKKALLLLLVTAMLFTTACASGNETSQSHTTVSQSDTEITVEDVVTTASKIEADLPVMDFEGYLFRVLTKGIDDIHWKSKDIYSEDLNGEAINDAVFQRNSTVGEKYNFTVKEIISTNGTWDLGTDVKKSVLAASDEYDMAAMGIISDLGNMATNGMLVDLHTVPHMDLTKPWYDQNANESLSIAGKLYTTTGDLLVMDNEATLAILYNKKIAEDYKVGDLYADVNEGKWTLDRYYDCITNVVKDLDGDGKQTEFDQWGVIGEVFNTYAYIVGANETVVEKDSDDLPRFRLENDKFYSAFDKANKINNDKNICLNASNYLKYSNVWTECIDKAFSEDRVLFNCAGLVRVTVFRAMNTDFGILPMPKFDESQEKYCDIINTGCSNSITIPSTVTNLERTGIIIEALSAESMYTVTPAYYDVTIKGKAIRDVESEAILDMIFANRIYDLSVIYDWGGLVGAINSLGTSKSPDVASTIAKNIEKAKIAMQKTVDLYLEIK